MSFVPTLARRAAFTPTLARRAAAGEQQTLKKASKRDPELYVRHKSLPTDRANVDEA